MLPAGIALAGIGSFLSGVGSIFGGRSAQRSANAQAAANMQWQRENMFHQLQWEQDEAWRSRDWQNAQFEIARNWEAGQAGIARDWESQQFGIERDFNASEAQKNRDFQAQMSNTQYQRAVEDMRLAGLNPMLAYSQGGAGNLGGSTASASAPSVGAPSVGAPSGAKGNASGAGSASMPQFRNYLGEGISSALQALSTLTGVEQVEASTEETKARTAVQLAEVLRVKSQAGLNSADQARVDAMVRQMEYDWSSGLIQARLRNQTDREASATRSAGSQADRDNELARQERMRSDYLKWEQPARLGEMAFHRMLNESMQGGASSATQLKDLLLRGLNVYSNLRR